jgi:hypothetical protein
MNTAKRSPQPHALTYYEVMGITMTFVILIVITAPNFLGDTAYYGHTVLGFTEGRDHWEFWDFGHLLWRPTILTVWQLSTGLTSMAVGNNPLHQIMTVEIALNLLAGLGCAVIVGAMAKLISRSSLLSLVVATTFVATNAILNHSQTGSAYLPGFVFILAGYYLLLRQSLGYASLRYAPYLAGASLAVGAGFWFVFSLAIPGATLLGFLTSRSKGLKNFFRSSLSSGALLLLIIASCAYISGIRSIAETISWARLASHGIEITGFSRMVFGFVNSFVELGNLGLIMKRYIIHDTLNPASLTEFAGRLWIVAAFYLALVTLFLRSTRIPDGCRLAAVSLLSFAPVIIFAIYWQGRDTERYLSLYPALIILGSFVAASSNRPGKTIMALCAAYLILHNTTALWHGTISDKNQETLARIAPLAEIAPPGSRIGVLKDSALVRLPWDLPFQYDKNKLAVHVVINLGMDKTPVWKKLLKEEVDKTWSQGGEFWISNRLVVEKPLSSWEWIEGEDRSIRWSDVTGTFKRFAYDKSIGGSDGFTRLEQSEANRAVLQGLGSQ